MDGGGSAASGTAAEGDHGAVAEETGSDHLSDNYFPYSISHLAPMTQSTLAAKYRIANQIANRFG